MITISVDNLSVLQALRDLDGRVSDMSPALNEIGMEIEGRVSARFETRRDPSGQAWKPWAESTRKSYPKDGNGSILDRYGDMLDSLSYQADKTSVSIGFGVDYAVYHEYGTRNMPRRGLLTADPDSGNLSNEDEQTVLTIVDRYLSAG
jgi:phage virion morphogenesis protein